MKRFAYVCADPGIPLPGHKGASHHVAAVCRAFVAAGLDGEVLAARAEAESVVGLPLRRLAAPAPSARGRAAGHEVLEALRGGVTPRPPYDFIYERYSLWHTGGLAAARALGIPFVLEVNSPLPEEAARFRGLIHEDLALAVARRLCGQADAVVCVSEVVSAWVRELRGHDERVWVVPNGVDAERFAPGGGARPPELPPPHVPLLVFCGSFRPWHGVEDLAQAFRLLVEHGSDAHLLCLGDGPQRAEFERRVREFGLADRVHCPGHREHDDVPRWLCAADVALAPYPVLEPFYFSPLKILEFMSVELPVVAADLGQIPELLGHGARGLLYPPGQPGELARAAARLLGDAAEARRMGRAGRAWVLAHATWAKRVEAILQRIEAL